MFESYAGKDHARQLTVERQRQLSDDLAFLAAKADMIMAACIQEDLDGKGMTGRIAPNTKNFSNVEELFTRIAWLLERAALRGLCPT